MIDTLMIDGFESASEFASHKYPGNKSKQFDLLISSALRLKQPNLALLLADSFFSG